MNVYYFISAHKLKEKYIHPRIPQNRLTNSGREDNKTPRICVSKSIDGCLSATRIYEKHKLIYLYSCVVDAANVIQPSERQVSDAKWTGEEWILVPTEMKLESILHIKKDIITKDYCRYKISDKKSIGFYNTEIISRIC